MEFIWALGFSNDTLYAVITPCRRPPLGAAALVSDFIRKKQTPAAHTLHAPSARPHYPHTISSHHPHASSAHAPYASPPRPSTLPLSPPPTCAPPCTYPAPTLHLPCTNPSRPILHQNRHDQVCTNPSPTLYPQCTHPAPGAAAARRALLRPRPQAARQDAAGARGGRELCGRLRWLCNRD